MPTHTHTSTLGPFSLCTRICSWHLLHLSLGLLTVAGLPFPEHLPDKGGVAEAGTDRLPLERASGAPALTSRLTCSQAHLFPAVLCPDHLSAPERSVLLTETYWGYSGGGEGGTTTLKFSLSSDLWPILSPPIYFSSNPHGRFSVRRPRQAQPCLQFHSS